jgi:hypothetical protein
MSAIVIWLIRNTIAGGEPPALTAESDAIGQVDSISPRRHLASLILPFALSSKNTLRWLENGLVMCQYGAS